MKADHFSSHPQRAAISLILVIVTSLLIVTPIVHAGISELEAREAAMQSCEDQLGYAKENQEIYDFTPRKGGGWAFGIKALESDGTMKEIIRGELDKDGKLITLTERGGHHGVRAASGRLSAQRKKLYGHVCVQTEMGTTFQSTGR